MLKDRVVLLTGAGGGMGRGIAKVLADKGAAVILADINEASVRAAETALVKYGCPAGVLALVLDITREDDVRQVIEQGVERFGKVDGLVNNAGVLLDKGPLLDSNKLLRGKEFAVNYYGTSSCSRAFTRQLINQKLGGNIVNVASQGGVNAHVMMANYSASKAAVINLTQGQSAEWAQYDINVNAVCPSGVHTMMLTAAAEAKLTISKSNQSAEELRSTWIAPQLGRKMEPWEVGYVIAFLLSDEAVLVRGQTISVTAGAELEVLTDYLN